MSISDLFSVWEFSITAYLLKNVQLFEGNGKSKNPWNWHGLDISSYIYTSVADLTLEQNVGPDPKIGTKKSDPDPTDTIVQILFLKVFKFFNELWKLEGRKASYLFLYSALSDVGPINIKAPDPQDWDIQYHGQCLPTLI